MNTIHCYENDKDYWNNEKFFNPWEKITFCLHIKILSSMAFAGDETVHRTAFRPMDACDKFAEIRTSTRREKS